MPGFLQTAASTNGMVSGRRSMRQESMGPSLGNAQGWNAKVAAPEPVYDAHKGEKPRPIAILEMDRRRTMETEITSRAGAFIKRNLSAGKPFFAHVSFSLMHMPTLPNPDFARRSTHA
jgi:hypothetical protein